MGLIRSFLRATTACAAVLATALVAAPGARAQGWTPDRPVTVVVPCSPGGGTPGQHHDDTRREYVARQAETLGMRVAPGTN
ncbi:MAG: hypothetical protein EHM87_00760 [Burkholderiales bacterium]|nr:MAG: hypothetical protein EHM87_00760 [Burkholderiales bacterium]